MGKDGEVSTSWVRPFEGSIPCENVGESSQNEHVILLNENGEGIVGVTGAMIQICRPNRLSKQS